MKKGLLFLTAVSGIPAACIPGNYHGPAGEWGPMMYYGHGGFFMWLLFLILVAIVIYLVVRVSKPVTQSAPPLPPPETPLDILKKRYAKGEINREDFDRMKKDLE